MGKWCEGVHNIMPGAGRFGVVLLKVSASGICATFDRRGIALPTRAGTQRVIGPGGYWTRWLIANSVVICWSLSPNVQVCWKSTVAGNLCCVKRKEQICVGDDHVIGCHQIVKGNTCITRVFLKGYSSSLHLHWCNIAVINIFVIRAHEFAFSGESSRKSGKRRWSQGTCTIKIHFNRFGCLPWQTDKAAVIGASRSFSPYD